MLKNSSQEECNLLEIEKQRLVIEKKNLDLEQASLIREVSEEKQRFLEMQKIVQMEETLPVSGDENVGLCLKLYFMYK